MSFDVKLVLDSVGPNDARIATFRLCYEARVHWDLLTHRQLGRNASSGRSISVTRMRRWLEKGPAKPLAWIADKKGMKSGGLLPEDKAIDADRVWQEAFEDACRHASRLESIGVHRQDANALLLPFGWINVLVTATGFDNLFSLRCDDAARPELQRAIVGMARLYRDSTPTPLKVGEWHLPYVTQAEMETLPIDVQLRLSVARCGHLTNEADEDERFDRKAELRRYDRFLGECAWSTFEHQAAAQNKQQCNHSGNLLGFDQYRQTLPKSVHASFDYSKLDQFGERGFIV